MTINLNDAWLIDLGFGWLDAQERRSFLGRIVKVLEKRVGEELSSGMSDDQLDEYASLLEEDESAVFAWIEREGIDPAEDPELRQLLTTLRASTAAGVGAGSLAAFRDWASGRWLAMHRPDYREIVLRGYRELEAELRTKAAELSPGNAVSDQRTLLSPLPGLRTPTTT